MTFIIAVAGKGGVGKSTISALLVRALAHRSGKVVMAIDADPNSNLGDKLGVTVEHTIGELREELLRNAEQASAAVSKQELVRYQMELAKVEGHDFDLLTMGRPEGRGCYCYINNILRTFIDEAMDGYDYVVIDNEAGMEHLSRRTTKRMDVLLVVSDATALGIETAKRILALARGMEIEMARTVLVINRVQGELPPNLTAAVISIGFDSYAVLPDDANIVRLATAGEPLTQLDSRSPLVASVTRLTDSIW